MTTYRNRTGTTIWQDANGVWWLRWAQAKRSRRITGHIYAPNGVPVAVGLCDAQDWEIES